MTSEPGQGTEFTVCIPIKATYSEHQEMSIPTEIIRHLPRDIIKPKGNGKTILLVEDTEAMIVQITDILESEGYSVVSAANGFEALDQLEKRIPDAVILDLMMPGMNGFEQQKHHPAHDRPFDLVIREPVQVIQFKPEIGYISGILTGTKP